MNKRIAITGCLTSILLSQTVCAAGPDILPGLWENKIDVKSESGQFEQAMEQAKQMLESMPPEQQKMVRDMMAKQGVNFDLASRTIEACLTQAQIDTFAIAETDKDCRQNFTEKSKNHYTMTVQCDHQNLSGEGEYIIKDNKHYAGTMVMNININGQQDTMTMKQDGTWKSSDCGDITPE